MTEGPEPSGTGIDEAGAPPEGLPGKVDEGKFVAVLRRAGEMVGAGRLPEAEIEIIQALVLFPHDLRALKLLALVRFKLGRLGEAREVYRTAVEVAPDDFTVRLNLGLIALKLEWFEEAVSELERATGLRADDARAWSYLGYAYARRGMKVEAAGAFRKGGQEDLASEMDGGKPAAIPVPTPADSAQVQAIGSTDSPGVSASAVTDSAGVDSASGSIEIASLADFAVARLLGAGDGALDRKHQGVLRFAVSGEALVRRSALLVVGSGLKMETGRRRKRGRRTQEALGPVDDPFIRCEGSADLWLCVPSGARGLVALSLEEDILYLREDRVVAWNGEVVWESGRAPWGERPLLQFRGGGRVVVACARGEMVALAVADGAPVVVAGERLVGWMGRIVAQGVRGEGAPGATHVACEGEGVLLLSAHGESQEPVHQST